MTTNAYAAKRAIFGRLVEHARAGRLSTLGVDGGPVQVLYDGDLRAMQRICVYGGGIRFRQPPERAMEDGGGRAAFEVATTSWFVRVVRPPDDGGSVVDLDGRAEEVGDAIGAILLTEPALAGVASRSYLTDGQGDYDYGDVDNVAVLSLFVATESWVT